MEKRWAPVRLMPKMKIRFYGQKSVKNYRTVLCGFLRWFGLCGGLCERRESESNRLISTALCKNI